VVDGHGCFLCSTLITPEWLMILDIDGIHRVYCDACAGIFVLLSDAVCGELEDS
jgi:hypothetical protein